MDPTLLLLVFLLLFSWFFSWAEIALVSLSPAKVKQLLEEKSFAAKEIDKLKRNPNKLLITILIWNNLVNIWASMITAIWATNTFWSEFLWLVTWVLTLLVLVFWEILPKSLAQKFNAQFSKVVAKPLVLLEYLLYPIVFLLEKFLIFTMKAFGSQEKLTTLTEEELKAMVQIWAEEWVLATEKHEMLANVLDFGGTTAEEIMTDKAKIASVQEEFTVKQTIDFYLKHEFTRIPVTNNEHKVIWIVTLSDLIKQKQNKNEETELKELDLKEPLFVPETKRITDLFKEFQWKRIHMAIVIDEFGEVAGLVTMEDILEEVFGEIHDESDEEIWKIKRLSENSWRVDWDTEIEKLNKELESQLPAPDHKTISYLILDQLQKIPERWDSVELKNFELFVEKMEENRIESVRMQRRA